MSLRPFLEPVCVALLIVGCTSTTSLPSGDAPTVGGVGVNVAKAIATDLHVTPDGKLGLFLADPQHPRLEGVPPQMVLGELCAAPLSTGALRRLGEGVTNMPGGWAISADSRWAFFLSNYNPASQEGQLRAIDLNDAKSESRLLGRAVTFFAPSPDSKWLALVDGGALKVAELGSDKIAAVGGDVASAQFSLDSNLMLFQRRLSAGGGLFAVGVGRWDRPTKLSDQVGDYEIASDSRHIAFTAKSDALRNTSDLFVAVAPDFKPKKVAFGCASFQFSPDAMYLARVEGQRGDSYKNIKVGELFVAPPDGGPAKRLGERVLDFTFAPDSKSIAYLDQYDSAAGIGTMTVATLPDGIPKKAGIRVPNFQWSPDSRHIAFLERFLKPVFSVDLMFYQIGQDEPIKLKEGVFGYGFAPKGEFVLMRSGCIREGRACDLYAADPAKPKDPPKKWVDAVYSFKVSDDASRVLVTYARFDSEQFDVALYDRQTGRRTTLDQHILLPASFASKDGTKAAYVVADRQRAGVYAATEAP